MGSVCLNDAYDRNIIIIQVKYYQSHRIIGRRIEGKFGDGVQNFKVGIE